jgi:hypothetical protein
MSHLAPNNSSSLEPRSVSPAPSQSSSDYRYNRRGFYPDNQSNWTAGSELANDQQGLQPRKIKVECLFNSC